MLYETGAEPLCEYLLRLAFEPIPFPGLFQVPFGASSIGEPADATEPNPRALRSRVGTQRAWRKWARRVVIGLTCVLVIAVAATARLFVWPPSDGPVRADAVAVLSGDFGDRLPVALRLIDEGLAPVLVHAGTPDSQEVLRLCRGEQRIGAEMVCIQPHPDSTRTEARAVAALARERRWDSLVVVTSRYHVVRAGMWFRRCHDGKVSMVATDPGSVRRVWLKQAPHEWAGLAEVLLRRGC